MEIIQTKLNECYPEGIIGNGIFTDLQELDVPWKDRNINTSLDIAYYGQHSGKKVISPFLENFLPDEDSKVSDANRSIIAKCLFDVYHDNWSHLWETTQQEYNMLWNTDATIIVETNNEGTNNKTISGTQSGTDTHKLSGTDTTTKDISDTTNTTGTDTVSNTGTDTHTLSGRDTTNHTGTDTHTLSGQDSVNHTGTDTHDTKTDTTVDDTGTDTTYHHSKSVQHNSDAHGHDNSTITQNKMAGFDSGETGRNTTYTKVTEDKQIVNRTYAHADDDGNLVDEVDDFHNSDKEVKALKSKTSGTGQDKDTVALTDTSLYGKSDTETLNLSDGTTYGKADEERINTEQATTYGKGETETIKGTDSEVNYGRTDTETLDLTNGSEENGGDTFKGTEETHRTGNIGITTNQQMIEAERQLWKWNFFNYIFKDIDRYLTLAVY